MRREAANNQNKEIRIFGKDITNQVNFAEKQISRINNHILPKVSDDNKKEHHVIRGHRARIQSMDENLLKKMNQLSNNQKNQAREKNHDQKNLKKFLKNSKNLISIEGNNLTDFNNFNNRKNVSEKNQSFLDLDIHMKTISDEKGEYSKGYNNSNQENPMGQTKFLKTNLNILSILSIYPSLTYKKFPHEEYLDDIYLNLLNEEFQFFNPLSFEQSEINERMRTILVSWVL